jgi:hypothetical protein
MNQDDRLYFSIKAAMTLLSADHAREKIRELCTPEVLRRMDRKNKKWQAERAKIFAS